jgi:hypothetical protein
MIDRRRVDQLAGQGTGHEALAEFLDRVRPDVDALMAAGARLKTWCRDTPDPIEGMALIGVIGDWFRLQEDEYRRRLGWALEALRLAEAHWEIIHRRVVTGDNETGSPSSTNEKLAKRHRALYRRLQDTRDILCDFVVAYLRTMALVRDELPGLLLWLKNGVGCISVHVSL